MCQQFIKENFYLLKKKGGCKLFHFSDAIHLARLYVWALRLDSFFLLFAIKHCKSIVQ